LFLSIIERRVPHRHTVNPPEKAGVDLPALASVVPDDLAWVHPYPFQLQSYRVQHASGVWQFGEECTCFPYLSYLPLGDGFEERVSQTRLRIVSEVSVQKILVDSLTIIGQRVIREHEPGFEAGFQGTSHIGVLFGELSSMIEAAIQIVGR
jgi:hypothetical protein